MTAYTLKALRSLNETRATLSAAEHAFARALAADLKTISATLPVVAKGERVEGTIYAERQQLFIILRTLQLLTEAGELQPFLQYVGAEMEALAARKDSDISTNRIPIYHHPKTLPKAFSDHYRQACRDYVAHVHPEEHITPSLMSKRALLGAGFGAVAALYFQKPLPISDWTATDSSKRYALPLIGINATLGGYAGSVVGIAFDALQTTAHFDALLNDTGNGKAAIYAHKYTFDALCTMLAQNIDTLAQHSPGTSRA